MRYPITRTGYAKMGEELRLLKEVERPRIIAAIAEARAHGDLSENAEYHAAREKQSLTEGRINDLQAKYNRAQIIDASMVKKDEILFGARVVLYDVDADAEKTFHLVSDYEARAESGYISVESPLARALLNREVGDLVTVRAPAGSTRYEVVSISYDS